MHQTENSKLHYHKLNSHAAISTYRVVLFSPVQPIVKAKQVSLCIPQDYHRSYHFQHGSCLPFSVIYFRILKNNQLNISVLMDADIQTTTGILAIAPKNQYCSRGGTSKIRKTSFTQASAGQEQQYRISEYIHLYIKSFQLYIKLKTQSCTTILSTALYMAAIAH